MPADVQSVESLGWVAKTLRRQPCLRLCKLENKTLAAPHGYRCRVSCNPTIQQSASRVGISHSRPSPSNQVQHTKVPRGCHPTRLRILLGPKGFLQRREAGGIVIRQSIVVIESGNKGVILAQAYLTFFNSPAFAFCTAFVAFWCLMTRLS